MPVEVGRFTTEVTLLEGDSALSPAQLEKLARMVLDRLDRHRRDEILSREATTIRRRAAPAQRDDW